jgi:hypothetical protein
MADPSERDAQYAKLCQAAGHLFIMFGRLEGTLTAALKLHLAMRMKGDPGSAEVALTSAVYGSMRFKAIRDTIKRIMHVEQTPEAQAEFVLHVFEQVGHIENLRDKIAHHLVVPAYEGAGAYWQVTDAVVTRDIRKPQVWVFDVDAVERAAVDLVLVERRLGGHLVGAKLFTSPEFSTSPVSWLYTPSMLKLVPQSKLKSPLGPLHQP